MSNETPDEEEDGEDVAEEEATADSARIQCSLGGLELEVEGGNVEEAEALFERVWGRRLSEAESFSDALRERMVGHQ